MRIAAKTVAVVAAGVAFISTFVAAPVLAGGPAALILDVSGSVEPEVALYDEVSDGTVLKLGSDASLTISHYGACEEVALSGGTVSVGAHELGIDGAQVRSRTAVQCPDQVVMAAADLINMAVTLRSAKQAKVMAAQPEFVLAGPWGRQFQTLDVYGEGGQKTSLPVQAGHAAWPADAQPLTAGQSYVVVLNGPGARQHAARIEVTADPPGMTVLKGR